MKFEDKYIVVENKDGTEKEKIKVSKLVEEAFENMESKPYKELRTMPK